MIDEWLMLVHPSGNTHSGLRSQFGDLDKWLAVGWIIEESLDVE